VAASEQSSSQNLDFPDRPLWRKLSDRNGHKVARDRIAERVPSAL